MQPKTIRKQVEKLIDLIQKDREECKGKSIELHGSYHVALDIGKMLKFQIDRIILWDADEDQTKDQ